MNILAVQPDIVWENKEANFARIRELLSRRSIEPGSLIVLPEMFSTGFSMNLAVTRQNEQRQDEEFLASLARATDCAVLGGVVTSGNSDKGHNQAVALAPDGTFLARYTKIHPFSLAGETECHECGAEIATFQWGGFTVAPFICYDLRFPEIFRTASRRGANLFVVMALWPSKRQQHWLTLLQARAIENQAYVVGVNRVGQEPQYTYAGRSIVVDPHGVIIADAGERESVLTTCLDLEVVEGWRRDFPALRDAHWSIG